jgi:hypothetical protein
MEAILLLNIVLPRRSLPRPESPGRQEKVIPDTKVVPHGAVVPVVHQKFHDKDPVLVDQL